MTLPLPARLNMIGPWLRARFGAKTVKLGLDLNLGCPRGLWGQRCIYCSEMAAGQGLGSLSLAEQLAQGAARAKPGQALLAYFQAHSSTHAPAAALAPWFYQAASYPGIKGIIISTRPDCLDAEHWQLLQTLRNEGHLLWLELGLQSANERTLALINRGHSVACFIEAAQSAASLGIPVVAHAILGLPGETREDTQATARLLAGLNIWGVKLHSIMVLEHTPLAQMWRQGDFVPWELPQWLEACAQFISLLPATTIIHRLSAEPGRGETCLAPAWVKHKAAARRALEQFLETHNIYQGQQAGAAIKPALPGCA